MRAYTHHDINKLTQFGIEDYGIGYFIRVALSHVPVEVRTNLYQMNLYGDLIGEISAGFWEGIVYSLSMVEVRRRIDRRVYQFLRQWGFRKTRTGWRKKEASWKRLFDQLAMDEL